MLLILVKDNKLLSFIDYLKRKILEIVPDKKEALKEEAKNLNYSDIRDIKIVFGTFIKDMEGKGYIIIIDFEEDNEMNTLKIFYICFIKKLLVPNKSKTVLFVKCISGVFSV